MAFCFMLTILGSIIIMIMIMIIFIVIILLKARLFQTAGPSPKLSVTQRHK